MSLPSGIVTFLFSDVEGSTRLAQRLGPDAWRQLIEAHDRVADAAVADTGGTVVKHVGDGMLAAFGSPADAVAAAIAFARGIAGDPAIDGRLRVRMGLHTGQGVLTSAGTDYAGVDTSYAARVEEAANGGQILLSESTARLVAEQLPAGTTLRDMGPGRVKDFEEPRRLSLLVVEGAADDPRPLRTQPAPSNLPEEVSSFVGRAVELAQVAELVRSGRLVTLTGPGGTGKTRLAIAVAGELRDELPGGAWLVELAPVVDPELVPSTIATALGVHEEPGRAIAETLKAALRDREALLVLDNLEQILGAAAFVTELLRAARGLRVLVTSREALRIAGEMEYRVPTLAALDAVSLFVERARAVRPDFRLTDDTARAIGQITERLDNLPLAIELAAARTRLFAPPALLARLERSLDVLTGGGRDLPERQRTLRATIAWSHELLEPPERILFRRLAPFSGGWTIEAAAAVCDPDGSLGIQVDDGLLSLLDKSLVAQHDTEHGEPRFHRLVTIREFAWEQLRDAGEADEVERRHAEYFLALAEEAEPELEYGDPGPWLARLDPEQHNVRSALDWSLRTGELELGLRLAGAIWRVWQHRSHLREGRDWVLAALERPEAAGPSPARFKALIAAGGLAYWLAEYATTRRCYEEALAIAEALWDERLRAEALYVLGFLAMVAGDTAELRRLHEASAELFATQGDRQGVSKVRQGLILVTFLDGDFAGAHALATEDVAYQYELGARSRAADSETLLAAASLRLGDLDDAVVHLARAIEAELELRLDVNLVGSVIVGALIANAAGDHERGARLMGHAAAIRERIGASNAPVDVLHLPDAEAEARGVLGAERYDALEAEGRTLPRDVAAALATQRPAGAATPASKSSAAVHS